MVITQAAFDAAVRAGDFVEGHDLSAIDWRDLPSGDVRVRNCSLVAGDLLQGELNEADFEAVTFVDCRFGGAELTNARFSQCSFFDAERRLGCDFADAQMRGASFIDCNLSMSRFAGANLHAVHWQGCKGAGADFEDASFSRKSGRTVSVAGRFVDCALDYVNFTRVCLDDCVFDGSSLRQADFKRCSMVGASLQRADLIGAVFDQARLDNGDLRGAVLTGFDITGLEGFAGIKLNDSQLGAVVGPLGVRVFPG
ncbi:pentapeptide repeat-containing protein [Devosia rhodophyticola]|uniref:Pentapeptide repeat-containing protein n=1 Tax=Devosia rhodophyticola TaxID=3026423 RepID=A0ABY7YWU0_9HYPH|nr:pentapeptide repeat-containing protein [Devosia rhodophyticola]WDR05719.1 pentapeptide repeat-containing protein [Devosia rhodophyticola]